MKTRFVLTGLLIAFLTNPAAAASLQWISPDHYRILLSVDARGVKRSNSPVSVNVDFPHELRARGAKGTFDEYTVEVVAYDASGKPRICDAARKGYEKYLVPSRLDKFYGASHVTLNFVMPDENHNRIAVYFDTKQSGLGRPKRYSGLVGDGDRFKIGYTRREIGASHMCCFCDFDGDGDLDLMKVTNEPFIYYYENVGRGRYVDKGRLASGGSLFMLPRSGDNRSWSVLEFADWDGDGDQDFFATFGDGNIQGDVYRFENTTARGGRITFTNRGTLLTVSGKRLGGAWFPAAKIVDWDGDGRKDVVVAQNGRIDLYRNIGTSKAVKDMKLADATIVVQEEPTTRLTAPRVDCADIDADGDLDMFVSTQGLNIHLYENTGTRTMPKFAGSVLLTTRCGGHTGVKVADFDGDGLLDYATGSAWEVGVKPGERRPYACFYKNVGTKTHPKFEERDAYHGGLYTEQIQIADVGRQNTVRASDWDNDGKMDLIASKESGAVFLFRNTTDNLFPVFEDGQYLLHDLEGGARSFVCDWNNDGRKDLLVTTWSGYVTLYFNKGTDAAPKLDAGVQVFANGKPIRGNLWCSLLVCDWDNDGKKDLVLGLGGQAGPDRTYDWPRRNELAGTDVGFLFYRNVGTDAQPELAYPSWVKSGFDGGDYIKYTRPNLGSYVDWTGDGIKDFIAAEFENVIRLYPNRGSGAPGVEPIFEWPQAGIPIVDGWTVQTISGADALDWNGDGDLDILTGQGHGGNGLRFYERDFIEDNLNNTHPRVTVTTTERKATKER